MIEKIIIIAIVILTVVLPVAAFGLLALSAGDATGVALVITALAAMVVAVIITLRYE